MTDRIFISNLRIHAYHGVKDAEKSLGQKFHIDLDCQVNRPVDGPDKMTQTVCYGELSDLVCKVSESETFNLIETLAERIAAATLGTFPMIQQVRIQIRKPSAPIAQMVDYAGVEITRSRNG